MLEQKLWAGSSNCDLWGNWQNFRDSLFWELELPFPSMGRGIHGLLPLGLLPMKACVPQVLELGIGVGEELQMGRTQLHMSQSTGHGVSQTQPRACPGSKTPRGKFRLQLEVATLRCRQWEEEDEEAELVRQCPSQPTPPAQCLPLARDSLITMTMIMVMMMMVVTVVTVMVTMMM